MIAADAVVETLSNAREAQQKLKNDDRRMDDIRGLPERLHGLYSARTGPRSRRGKRGRRRPAKLFRWRKLLHSC